jgi:hypothetical protein
MAPGLEGSELLISKLANRNLCKSLITVNILLSRVVSPTPSPRLEDHISSAVRIVYSVYLQLPLISGDHFFNLEDASCHGDKGPA